jgi:peptidoglycan/xylan/chitin deacetylase (PgdA/CDA1 family)
MRERPRALAMAALLSATLALTGCAAGSPAIVAPTAQEQTAAQEAVAAPQAAQAPAPTTAPVIARNEPPEPTSAAEPVVQPAGTANDAAAFSQSLPAVGAAQGVAENTVDLADPATEVAPAPPLQTDRPPPPPDPGTGLSEIIEGGSNGRLEVALTFDAGADTGYAPQILDYLRDEGIHATFGMTGQWAQANPDLVKRMVAEGHQLINHTWDHASLTGANTGMPPLTPEQVAQELGDTEAVVRDLTGYEMRPYFRPPYGDYDEASLRYLYDDGYYLSIWWTCDTHGWAGWGSQEIIDYCTTNIGEDEILLLHVGSAAAGDFEALPGLVQFFRDDGYAFVTVEQMLQP